LQSLSEYGVVGVLMYWLAQVIEMASQNSAEVTADRFFDCMRDCGIDVDRSRAHVQLDDE
jgi:hypothetical protein